ncbi:MAG TPA: Coenzyme F420 hydrogenase/dehydrogenase, beta subunit C-terminal domain [Candidatus Bathyarchaeia archaeon]
MPNTQAEKNQNYKTQDETKIEQQFLEGSKDPNIGIYSNIFSAKSKFQGQDGGMVTALLVKGFEEHLFDAAVVVYRGDGYSAKAVVITNAKEAVAAAGTIYLRVNGTKKLLELISQGKRRVAIVCTPCEAKAARKIQQSLKNDCEITVIGLFCFEAFNRTKLKEEMCARLGIDLDKVVKTQIHQGKFTAFADGKEYSCKVKDLDGAAEKGCLYCDDFTSRFADVSVGSVGSKPGFSSVVVRSKVGVELVKNLDAAKEKADKEEVARLSKFKMNRAKKALATLNEPK